MDGDVTNSLVATLAALAVGLVLGAADVKHETRGGVQAAVHNRVHSQEEENSTAHSCDFFTGL